MSVLLLLLFGQGVPLMPPAEQDEIEQEDAYEGLPPLVTLDRFPSHYKCISQIELCQAYDRWLVLQHQTCPSAATRRAIREVKQSLVCWQMLQAAYQDHLLSEGVRRGYLRDYREMIGYHRYEVGWHPVFLPGDVPTVPRPPPRPEGNGATP